MGKTKTTKPKQKYITYLKLGNGAVLKIIRDGKPNFHQDMLVKR